MSSLVLGVVLAFAASALYCVGLALQALEARTVSDSHFLRMTLFRRLLAKPRWIAGTALSVCGWPLEVAALLLAPLTLVQPALAAGLLVLLPLGARYLGEEVGRKELGAVLMIVVGVAGVAFASPARTLQHASPAVLGVVVCGLLLAALVPWAFERVGSRPGVIVAFGAGLAYAGSALATKLVSDALVTSAWVSLSFWIFVTTLAAGIAVLAEMSTLQRRPATRVAPIVFVTQLVVPVLLAPLLVGESWSDTPIGGLALFASLALLAGGVVVLARTPAVGALVNAAATTSAEPSDDGDPEMRANRRLRSRPRLYVHGPAPKAPDDRRIRVLVLTAPVGEGHVAAARALSEGILRTNGEAEVTVVDALAALPQPLRWLLCDAYRWQLRKAPWMFGLLFAGLRRSRVLRYLARVALSLVCSRALLRLLRRHPAEVVVSTWPVTTVVSGSLRRRGKVRVPVYATITDFAGLELWADKGVDFHLVMHESVLPVVERIGGSGSVRVVRPLVASEFLRTRSVGDARRALDLPTEGTLIVVSGGGWGVGDLRGAVEAACEIEGARVVCLAGRDVESRARLEHAFGTDSRVTVLGFTDKMSDLLAAADVLVHSTGGVTCLEALACGCPIVAYGPPPGHAPLLAEEMSKLGLLAYARSAAELRAALVAAARQATNLPSQGVDAASLVVAPRRRVTVRLRTRVMRPAVTACAVVVALFALLASDATYPVVAEALALPKSTSISSRQGAVPLVIRGQRRDLLALATVARHMHLNASVAALGTLSQRDVAALRASGLDPIPALRARGIRSFFETPDELSDEVTEFGLRGRPFYYLAPLDGFTIADYLFARRIGGRPIQAGYILRPRRNSLASVQSGEIVVATLGRGSDNIARLVTSVRELEHSGLTVSSVGRSASRGSLSIGTPGSRDG